MLPAEIGNCIIDLTWETFALFNTQEAVLTPLGHSGPGRGGKVFWLHKLDQSGLFTHWQLHSLSIPLSVAPRVSLWGNMLHKHWADTATSWRLRSLVVEYICCRILCLFWRWLFQIKACGLLWCSLITCPSLISYHQSIHPFYDNSNNIFHRCCTKWHIMVVLFCHWSVFSGQSSTMQPQIKPSIQ